MSIEVSRSSNHGGSLFQQKKMSLVARVTIENLIFVSIYRERNKSRFINVTITDVGLPRLISAPPLHNLNKVTT